MDVEELARQLFLTDWPNDKWERFKDGDHAKMRYVRMAETAISAIAKWIEPQRSDVPAHGWEFATAIEALKDVRKAIIDADPEVLTDTLWMSGNEFFGGTVVDRIDHALEHYGIQVE